MQSKYPEAIYSHIEHAKTLFNRDGKIDSVILLSYNTKNDAFCASMLAGVIGCAAISIENILIVAAGAYMMNDNTKDMLGVYARILCSHPSCNWSLFISETWQVAVKPEEEDELPKDLETCPGRTEQIFVSYEDRDGAAIRSTIPISRDADKATLGEMVYCDDAKHSGRFIGLFEYQEAKSHDQNTVVPTALH